MSSPHPERIAVVGLGLLGRGIAACLLGHGFSVVAIDSSEAQHTTAREHIERMIGELIERSGFPGALRDEWGARYRPARECAAAADCAFVVESVTEDVAIKAAVFDALEEAVPDDVVIASNTSSIPITQLQAGRKVPARFVGMHWAQPAHATRFLELIRGEQTSDAALAAATELGRRLGKDPSLCQRDVPAFIVNRIAYAMYREAAHLVETGVADVETIDTAIRNTVGLWASICGPFRWIDVSGGPALYGSTMQRVLPTLSKADDIPPFFKALMESGARGTTNGRGFYDYTPEQAQAWERLLEEHVWKIGALVAAGQSDNQTTGPSDRPA